jgi:AcrR family transcriptional regulator
MASQDTSGTDTTLKRGLILDQAIITFAQEGFRRADVQVIADQAGVGKGTVYRYFGNKEDLFWAGTLAVTKRLEQHLVDRIQGIRGPLEKLRASGRAYAEFFQANPEYLEIFVQERAEFRGSAPPSHIEYHEKLIGRLAGILEEGIASGEIRPVDVRRTIIALGGVLYGSVVHACYAVLGGTLTEAAEYALDIFLEGIRGGEPKT